MAGGGGSPPRAGQTEYDDEDEYDDEEDEYDDEDEEGEYDDEDEDEEEFEELAPTEAARAAVRHLAQLNGKELNAVVSLARSGEGWEVGVEMVEDRRIPSSNDVLGLYLVQVDVDGSLLSYRRSRRYARGRGDSSEVI